MPTESVFFIREGCAELARNIVELLHLAGMPVTPDSVIAVVKSLPRDYSEINRDSWYERPCGQALKLAKERHPKGEPWGRFEKVVDYFCDYIPQRPYAALFALQDAFFGVLSVEFDPPAIEQYAQQEPTDDPVRLPDRRRW